MAQRDGRPASGRRKGPGTARTTVVEAAQPEEASAGTAGRTFGTAQARWSIGNICAAKDYTVHVDGVRIVAGRRCGRRGPDRVAGSASRRRPRRCGDLYLRPLFLFAPIRRPAALLGLNSAGKAGAVEAGALSDVEEVQIRAATIFPLGGAARTGRARRGGPIAWPQFVQAGIAVASSDRDRRVVGAPWRWGPMLHGGDKGETAFIGALVLDRSRDWRTALDQAVHPTAHPTPAGGRFYRRGVQLASRRSNCRSERASAWRRRRGRGRGRAPGPAPSPGSRRIGRRRRDPRGGRHRRRSRGRRRWRRR